VEIGDAAAADGKQPADVPSGCSATAAPRRSGRARQQLRSLLDRSQQVPTLEKDLPSLIAGGRAIAS
jgi:hypothetical protein